MSKYSNLVDTYFNDVIFFFIHFLFFLKKSNNSQYNFTVRYVYGIKKSINIIKGILLGACISACCLLSNLIYL